MSDVADRLDRIRERVEAATEGPWTWEPFGEKANNWTVGVAVYESGERHTGQLGYHDDAVPVQKVAQRHDAAGYKDADFIAHSRSDVPYLLSRLEEVVDLLDGWERAYPTDIFPEPPERPDRARLVWVDPDTGEKLSETFALGRVSAAMGRFMAADLRRALRDAAQEGEG